MTKVMPYDNALAWAAAAKGKRHVLLGNGFSMAYDAGLFGYAALARRAEDHSLLTAGVARLMESIGTPDFEATMRTLMSAIVTLRALDPTSHATTITQLGNAVDELREALARSIAGLHPDRPYDIDIARYRSVRRFLQPFDHIYTVNYDLLLYWALMQEVPDGKVIHAPRARDDGFRDSGVADDTTVIWDLYDPFKQTVYYLHGALHLFLGDDGLRKLTWIRTAEALIDQTRGQLALGRFPLYVAEADSPAKLDRINRSGYLSRGLRSLTSLGGSMIVYGHSLDANDDHVLEALVRSKVKRLAISIHGDPASAANQRLAAAAKGLVDRRNARSSRSNPLSVAFFDSANVELWQAVT